jgi:hypothetical protein
MLVESSGKVAGVDIGLNDYCQVAALTIINLLKTPLKREKSKRPRTLTG